MKRSSVLALGLVSLATSMHATPAGTAETRLGALVLEGSRSSYTEFVVEEPLEIRCCRVGPDGVPGFQLGSDATHVGFLIERMPGRKPVFGMLRVPTLDSKEPFLLPLANQPQLGPGVYRVYLLADGRASVRVLMAGLMGRLELRPDNLASTSGFLRGIGARVAHYREDVLIDKRSLAVIALSYSAPQTPGSTTELCIVPRGTYCGSGQGPAEPEFAHRGRWYAIYYKRGVLRSVPSEAVFTLTSVPLGTDAKAFALVLD